MTTYRFSLTAKNRRQSGCVRDADSDDQACELSSELLLKSDYTVIEVWRGMKMIYRVSKANPDESAHRSVAP